MPRLREATRLERRQAFVNAAWRCAATRGYHAMTVEDVCAEAGVSKGAFYVHFASKHDLLTAIIEDDVAALRGIVESLDRRRLGPTESLRGLTQAMLQQGDDPARVQVRADVWAAVLADPDVREQARAAVTERRRLLRAWIEEAIAAGEMVAVPANALASVLLALNDGLILHHALDRSGFRWANVRVALDALLAGIRQP
ncbi:MAG: TetR/AcrR family transcriptional regulator [Candidatus Dormibacteria bacterium]